MKSKTIVFFITAKTHLHVGSGDSNFGIIDNLVQRDPVTKIPCIHGSSLKGAIKEYCEEILDWKQSGISEEVFGTDTIGKRKTEKTEFMKGSHGFFQAHLLSMPARCNFMPFFRATSKETIQSFLNDLVQFDSPDATDVKKALQPLLEIPVQKGQPVIFINKSGKIEDWPTRYETFDASGAEKYLGKNIALLDWEDFQTLSNDNNLPVIARNQLDNGESKNLWYEQVVPKESLFYTMMLAPHNSDQILQIADNGRPLIQLGANATVGYGYCRFNLLN
jgi:CRISPR-associated protein Cmr4